MTLVTRSEVRLVNVEQLKARVAESISLSEVAERLCDVELKASGQQLRGLCPLHDEDTPSFYISDNKGLFHCWGCKAGGDAIQLVREVHHLDFRSALAMLAELAEVDLSEYERPPTKEEKERDELRAWCEDYLARVRRNSPRVREQDLLAAYGVGIPRPELANNIPPYLRDKHYLLRGEVIFPYRTANGMLCGWKVRHADGKQFGTPADFPLAKPAFFGLDVALPHVERGQLLAVEGEYDTLAIAEHGRRDVVGIGGSSVSDQQIQLLIDLKIREVTFWFDGDEGGRTGATAVAKRHWANPDITIRIALAPEGSDPEDIVRTLGVVEYKERGALEWLLWQEYEKEPRSTLSAKLDFVRWVMAEYGDKLRGLQQTLVLQEVARWLGVSDADVLDFARQDKTLLMAPDSEKAVLGRACREPNYFLALRKKLRIEDFYVLKHQRIWQAITELLMDGVEFEPATVKHQAERQGVDPEFTELVLQSGATNIGWHEDHVLDLSIRRFAQQDADRFRQLIADPNVPANQSIGVLTHGVTSRALGRASGALAPMTDIVDKAMDTLHERMANPDAIHGLDLGSQFPMLSRMIQGLQPRRLVCLAATSGVGKSTLTLQWATQLAVGLSVPIDFISLEMDTDEIVFKMAAHMTGIDGMKITGGRVSTEDMQRVERAMLVVRKSPLRIWAPDGLTASEFVLYARESVMERRTEVFVVDYAQMVGPDPGQERLARHEVIGHFAYVSKQKVARALDTTVICPAQLNRQAAEKERPTKEDMGESYKLVQASDVIFILRGDEDAEVMDFFIDKNRQGVSNILLPIAFERLTQTFRESSGGAKDPTYRVLS